MKRNHVLKIIIALLAVTIIFPLGINAFQNIINTDHLNDSNAAYHKGNSFSYRNVHMVDHNAVKRKKYDFDNPILAEKNKNAIPSINTKKIKPGKQVNSRDDGKIKTTVMQRFVFGTIIYLVPLLLYRLFLRRKNHSKFVTIAILAVYYFLFAAITVALIGSHLNYLTFATIWGYHVLRKEYIGIGKEATNTVVEKTESNETSMPSERFSKTGDAAEEFEMNGAVAESENKEIFMEKNRSEEKKDIYNLAFCHKCGVELYEDAAFCQCCGTPVPGQNTIHRQ